MLHDTAYAKINLALHVRRRRADGYHDIESLFVFARHGDGLSVEDRGDGALSLTLSGPFAPGLDAGPGNLVLKAAEALRKAAGQGRGASIHLDKRLPVASGIGGGSADAAAALRLLTRLWNLEPAMARDLAETLGADVPACLLSQTLMVTGKGAPQTAHILPQLAGTPLLLVNPGVPLPTGPVFAGWDQVDRGPLDTASFDTIIAAGRNDLQPPAIARAPVIGEVLEALARQPGVLLSRMSGSGATCFALFRNDAARDTAAASIAAAYPQWWLMRSAIRSHEGRDDG